MLKLRTIDDRARVLLACPLYGRSQLEPYAGRCNREEIMRRLSGGDLQISIDRTQKKETFVFLIDQDRSGGKCINYRLATQIRYRRLTRCHLALASTRRDVHAVACVSEKAEFTGSATTNMSVKTFGFGDYFKAIVAIAD